MLNISRSVLNNKSKSDVFLTVVILISSVSAHVSMLDTFVQSIAHIDYISLDKSAVYSEAICHFQPPRSTDGYI